MKNADRPIAPLYDTLDPKWQTGLTKREYFAAMAMQGIISNTDLMSTVQRMSCDAVIFADALLAELEKDNG